MTLFEPITGVRDHLLRPERHFAPGKPSDAKITSAKHPTIYPTDHAKTYSVLTPVKVGEGQESSVSAAILLPEREGFADVARLVIGLLMLQPHAVLPYLDEPASSTPPPTTTTMEGR